MSLDTKNISSFDTWYLIGISFILMSASHAVPDSSVLKDLMILSGGLLIVSCDLKNTDLSQLGYWELFSITLGFLIFSAIVVALAGFQSILSLMYILIAVGFVISIGVDILRFFAS